MNDIMKQAIVYGGAFNPPTCAHAQIIEACIDYARQLNAEFWILPSGDRHDKVITATREQRLAYLDALLGDVMTDGVETKVLTTELDRTCLVETYDTVVELGAAYPNHTLRWVFGADSTETMADWKEGAWLLTYVPKLIIERPGSIINPLAKKSIRLPVHTTAVSSTEVRRRIAANEPIDALVSPSVARLLVS